MIAASSAVNDDKYRRPQCSQDFAPLSHLRRLLFHRAVITRVEDHLDLYNSIQNEYRLELNYCKVRPNFKYQIIVGDFGWVGL